MVSTGTRSRYDDISQGGAADSTQRAQQEHDAGAFRGLLDPSERTACAAPILWPLARAIETTGRLAVEWRLLAAERLNAAASRG